MSRTAADVAAFYDKWTDLFVGSFGSVLQAGLVPTGSPPTEDPARSVLALAARAGLEDGDRVLDAGCGVGGPAIILASHYPRVTIDGVTISSHQTSVAREAVSSAGLEERVRIHTADYQRLPFGAGIFDQVFFMESTGYATDLGAVFSEALRVVKPGGRLYVKDVFCRSGPLDDDEVRQMETFDELWGCVRSKTLDESVQAMTDAGFAIHEAAPMDIGDDRLLGSMFDLAPDGTFRLTQLGEVFWRDGLDPPILYGEIKAVAAR